MWGGGEVRECVCVCVCVCEGPEVRVWGGGGACVGGEVRVCVCVCVCVCVFSSI